MKKISERIDLSRKVLDINVDSPIFKEMLDNLDNEIQRCIKKVFDKDFQGGEITLKLNIEIPEAYKIFPRKNEFGEMVNDTYTFRQPRFKHAVSAVLKKQFKTEGEYIEEREVRLDDDGNYIAVPVINAQMTIDDFEN